MPFLISRVNVPISREQEIALKTQLGRRLGIRSLPCYLIQSGAQSVLMQRFDAQAFAVVIDRL